MGGYASNLQLPNYQDPYAPRKPFDPNAAPGGNPVYYGQQIGAQGDPSLSFQPDLTTNDPNRIFRNAQNVGYNLGAGIDANLNQLGQQQGQLYAGYGNQMNAAYGDLAQTPGYTDQEAQNIVRDPQFNSLQMSGQERSDIMGNPQPYLDSTYSGMNDAQRNQATGLQSALNTDNLTPGQGYRDQMSDVANATQGQVQQGLGQAEGYLGGAQGQVQQGLGTQGLNPTSDYLRQAGMSDQEVAQQSERAASNVGAQYGSLMDDAARRAAASGNTGSLAVGAQRQRLAGQQAVATADAATDAQLAARGQQRQAASGVQQTQMGAAQYQAGQRINSGLELGQMGQQVAGQRTNAGLQLGGLAQQGVQGVQNTTQQAAQYQAGLRSNAANAFANTQTGASEYLGNLSAGAEQNQSNRAANVTGMRYGQGMGVNSALSQGYGQVAGARMGGQQQVRNWLTGQTGQALGAQQTANQQRIGNYGTMTGAMNTNAGQWGNYQLGKSQQGVGTNFKQAFGKGLGGSMSGPIPIGG